MKYVPFLIAVMTVTVLTLCCSPSHKTMTPEKFLKIENEILSTDLTPEAKEAVLKKYNFTLKEFEDYAQKVESDPELKAKVGEARLKKIQGERE